MHDEFERRLKRVDQAILTPLVRRNLENEKAEVLNWHVQPVEGGFGGSYGVYRFRGKAQVEGDIRAWSLILKAMGPVNGSQELANWNYWKREVLVYQSGLLNDLSGDLLAACCIDIAEYPGQECWLWLEDVVESGEKIWPLERYGLAARHLGQFNGVYLAGKPIPKEPWLSISQIQEKLTMAELGIKELPQVSQHPVFEGLLLAGSLERYLKLWAERRQLLTLLNRLPQTLCHHDAFRRNLIARNSPNGHMQTVAIDWAQLGSGTIGEEIAALFAGSLRFVAFDIDTIAELDNQIFAGYVDGLRDAGWQGDARLIRFGYTALTALNSISDLAIKWPKVAGRVAALPAGSELPRLLNPGGPIQHAASHHYFLNLGDEALALLKELS